MVTATFQLPALIVLLEPFPVSPASSSHILPCSLALDPWVLLNSTQFHHFIKHLPTCVYVWAKVPVLTMTFMVLAAAWCCCCSVAQKTFQ